MAEVLFTKIYNKQCVSVWTVVWDNEWVKIKDIPEAEKVIGVLLEEWIDVSNNTRKQLTEEICNNAERIIMMAEPETIPTYINNYNNVTYWDVDNPKWMDYEWHKRVMNEIKEHIIQLG